MGAGGRQRNGFENLEDAFHVFFHHHDCCAVVELVAVVGRREESYELLICEKLEAVLDHLMRSDDDVDFELLAESLDCIRSEVVTDSSGRRCPPVVFVVGIRPEKVAGNPACHESLVVQRASDVPDLSDVRDVATDSSVHAQDPSVDERGQGHVVKNRLKGTPKSNAEPSVAVVVESVNTIDAENNTSIVVQNENEVMHLLGAFMVSPQENDALGEPDLLGQKQHDAFQRVPSAVDVVPEEQVAAIRRGFQDVEDSLQVCELSVNVSHHNHGDLCDHQSLLFRHDSPSFSQDSIEILFLVRDFWIPHVCRPARVQSDKSTDVQLLSHLLRHTSSRRKDRPGPPNISGMIFADVFSLFLSID